MFQHADNETTKLKIKKAYSRQSRKL